MSIKDTIRFVDSECSCQTTQKANHVQLTFSSLDIIDITELPQ